MTDQTTKLEKIETQSSIIEKSDPDFSRRYRSSSRAPRSWRTKKD